MGIHYRHQEVITLKGIILDSKLFYSEKHYYPILYHSELIKHHEYYLMLQRVGYVYAVINYVEIEHRTLDGQTEGMSAIDEPTIFNPKQTGGKNQIESLY